MNKWIYRIIKIKHRTQNNNFSTCVLFLEINTYFYMDDCYKYALGKNTRNPWYTLEKKHLFLQEDIYNVRRK